MEVENTLENNEQLFSGFTIMTERAIRALKSAGFEVFAVATEDGDGLLASPTITVKASFSLSQLKGEKETDQSPIQT